LRCYYKANGNKKTHLCNLIGRNASAKFFEKYGTFVHFCGVDDLTYKQKMPGGYRLKSHNSLHSERIKRGLSSFLSDYPELFTYESDYSRGIAWQNDFKTLVLKMTGLHNFHNEEDKQETLKELVRFLRSQYGREVEVAKHNGHTYLRAYWS
jgi:hypothetical protein